MRQVKKALTPEEKKLLIETARTVQAKEPPAISRRNFLVRAAGAGIALHGASRWPQEGEAKNPQLTASEAKWDSAAETGVGVLVMAIPSYIAMQNRLQAVASAVGMLAGKMASGPQR